VDGKPQSITSLERQELPLIYALAVDSSGSMRTIFSDIKGSAKSIVTQNNPNDEMILLSFVSKDNIKATKDFSSDKDSLVKLIDSLAVEGGATALIDAIYEAAKRVAENKRNDPVSFRRAVVVITDGEDRESNYKENELLELVKKENIQVFFVGLVNELDDSSCLNCTSTKEKAKKFIKKITEASGGAVIVPKKINNLPEAANQIMPLVRTQYLITYASPSDTSKYNSQNIEVKLSKDSKRKDVHIYFRH
jgi:VWFA-related protein